MRCIIFLFSIMSITACNKPAQRNNEITKVELARSGAWSDNGATISIDTSLNYKYFGDYGNVKQGYFIGKVNNKFWDTLNEKFEQIKFRTIDTNDNTNVADVNYFEVIIHWKNQKRRIIRIRPRENDPVINTFVWLNDSYKNVKLHPVRKPIKFETIYHRPLPRLNIDQVEFPPPIPKKFKNIK